MNKLFPAVLGLVLIAGLTVLGADRFVVGCAFGSIISFFMLGYWEL